MRDQINCTWKPKGCGLPCLKRKKLHKSDVSITQFLCAFLSIATYSLIHKELWENTNLQNKVCRGFNYFCFTANKL